MFNESAPNLLTQNAMVGKLHEISHRKTLKEVFHHFKGVDKDLGVINFEEFKKLAQKIPILKDQNTSSLLETFRKIDIDSSGDLTISEFHTFYAQMKLSKKPKQFQPYPDIDLVDLKGLAFVRKYIWLTLDTHETSLGKICGPTMFFIIVFSVLSYCVATVPQLGDWPGWRIIDAITSTIFTVEFLLRFVTTGQKLAFLTEPFNIIDLCSFMPYYIEIAMISADVDEMTSMNYLRVLRICRLMKVIRISRYMSSYLEIFAETVILARHSFSMLMSLILFGTTVLSALLFSVEEDAGTFASVFEAMYWCVITQTTVGYGDIQVVTDAGRLLACVTAYAGIFNLTIMVNVMGSCFDEAYTRFLTKEENNFKMQLGLEMNMNSWEDIRKSIGVNPKHSSQANCASQLFKKVARLSYCFSDIETASEIFNCDTLLVELMVDVKDLLENVISQVDVAKKRKETFQW